MHAKVRSHWYMEGEPIGMMPGATGIAYGWYIRKLYRTHFEEKDMGAEYEEYDYDMTVTDQGIREHGSQAHASYRRFSTLKGFHTDSWSAKQNAVAQSAVQHGVFEKSGYKDLSRYTETTRRQKSAEPKLQVIYDEGEQEVYDDTEDYRKGGYTTTYRNTTPTYNQYETRQSEFAAMGLQRHDEGSRQTTTYYAEPKTTYVDSNNKYGYNTYDANNQEAEKSMYSYNSKPDFMKTGKTNYTANAGDYHEITYQKSAHQESNWESNRGTYEQPTAFSSSIKYESRGLEQDRKTTPFNNNNFNSTYKSEERAFGSGTFGVSNNFDNLPMRETNTYQATPVQSYNAPASYTNEQHFKGGQADHFLKVANVDESSEHDIYHNGSSANISYAYSNM